MTDSPKKPEIKIDKKTALLKAEHYCAYQERSQQEIRNKLYELGLWKNEVEEIISELIQTNFLNEERFTLAYVSGKFKIKKWGKMKIKQGLKAKGVTDKMILNALKTIDYDDYLETIRNLADKKLPLIKETDAYKRKYKLTTYLMTKGFESNSISEALDANGLE